MALPVNNEGQTIDKAPGSIVPSTPTIGPGSMPDLPTKPVTSISTDHGVSTLQATMAQATKLAGAPPVPPTTTTVPPKTTDAKNAAVDTANQTKVTLINPTTQQSVSFNDAATNKENIQSYMASGYALQDASGALPDWLTPTGKSSNTTITGSATPTGNPALDTANQTYAQAQSDLAAAKSKLSGFDVSQDPQLQSILSGITSRWDSQIGDLRKAEDSRIAALNTTGLRMGSQFTGGLGGVTGSIITGEQQNAIAKIGDLEAQKQQALTAARSAFETQKWGQYNDLVQVAQKAYDQQLTHLTDLQKAQATQDQKIKDKQVQATRDSAIAGIVAQGITDPTEISQLLDEASKASGQGPSDFTADEIDKALKVFKPADELAGVNGDLKTFKYLQKNNPELVKGMDYFDFQAAQYNATHKPAADDGGGSGTPPISFDAYVKAAGDKMGMDINPGSDLYKQAQTQYQSYLQSQPVPLGNLTSTEKNTITRAGLSTAPSAVKSYFLSTQPAFQDSFTRDVLSGSANTTIDGIHKAYEDWTAANSSSATGKVDALIKALQAQ